MTSTLFFFPFPSCLDLPGDATSCVAEERSVTEEKIGGKLSQYLPLFDALWPNLQGNQ